MKEGGDWIGYENTGDPILITPRARFNGEFLEAVVGRLLGGQIAMAMRENKWQAVWDTDDAGWMYIRMNGH